jgi:hypothetical protein
MSSVTGFVSTILKKYSLIGMFCLSSEILTILVAPGTLTADPRSFEPALLFSEESSGHMFTRSCVQ